MTTTLATEEMRHSGFNCLSPLQLLVLLLMMSNAASAITVRVGAAADPACAAHSIQSALAQIPTGAGAHRILLSINQTYPAAGLIENRNVSIEGGYANCSAVAPVAGVRTAIGPSPAATAPLLTMRRSDGGFGHEATLRNLEFRGPAPAGAILVDGPVDVTLLDTHVRDAGDAFLASGGGIKSQARGLIALRGDVEISGNRAEFGAGIACEDGFLDILSSDALISGNIARIAGGGVSLTRCTLSWSPDSPSAEAGILGNRALIGGGLYLRNSIVTGSGIEPPGPRRIIANTAEYSGGGIALAEDSFIGLRSLDVSSNFAGIATTPDSQGNCAGIDAYASRILLDAFRIEGNVARGHGAGVCLSDGSSFAPGEPLSCVDGACRSVSFNRAGTAIAGAAGAAFWLGNNAQLTLFATRMLGNSAPMHAVIHAEDDGQTPRIAINLINTLIARNTANGNGGLIGVTGTDLRVNWSTIADNASGAAMLSALGGNALDLTNSIIRAAIGTSVLSASAGVTLNTRCLLAHESTSLWPHGGAAFIGEPGFVDQANQNYQLAANASALDFCAGDQDSEPRSDISGNPRRVDLPIDDVLGPWDFGAYERQGAVAAIFASSFE